MVCSATGTIWRNFKIFLNVVYIHYYSGRKAPSWGFASVLFRVFFSGSSCSACARSDMTGVDVLCLFYFCTYMCPRFVQYIYTSLLLKWRSVIVRVHTQIVFKLWGFVLAGLWLGQTVHRHHPVWQTEQTVHIPLWQNNSSPSMANSWIRHLRDKVITECKPESRWLSMVDLNTLNSWNSSSCTDKIIFILFTSAWWQQQIPSLTEKKLGKVLWNNWQQFPWTKKAVSRTAALLFDNNKACILK